MAATKTRRRKREKDSSISSQSSSIKSTSKRKSKSLQKHGSDAPSGGIEALLPSFIGLAILVCGVMAKMGFRGRATVAGIDLGTTNSVICVQAPSKTGTFYFCGTRKRLWCVLICLDVTAHLC